MSNTTSTSGVLTAEDFDSLIKAVAKNTAAIESLRSSVVKSVQQNGKVFFPIQGNIELNTQTSINGKDGDKGEDGVSVIDSKLQYYVSTSEDELDGGEWSDFKPITLATHLWLRFKFIFSDETIIYTSPFSVSQPSGFALEQISDLKDVVLTNPSANQILVYDGSKWLNKTIPSGLDESQLDNYLSSHKYATQDWVIGERYASNEHLEEHINDTSVHVSALERANWNQAVTHIAAITGVGTDGVIDRWNEIVAFLDTYTEADTLASLLSNKAEKKIKLQAGDGLVGGGDLTENRTISLAKTGIIAGDYTKVSVDSYGRVTQGTSLLASDIPLLSISKITGLQDALDHKLDVTSFNVLKTWPASNTDIKQNDVLSASLGYDLYSKIGVNQSNISDVSNRLATIEALGTLATQPWVTSVLGNYYSKAEADARFLRQHQSLADYVTLNTVQTIRAAKTFTDELIATEKWITAKVITGETGAANNTVQRKKAHGIELGYPNRDYMNFNEFGGVFNFYRTNLAYHGSGDGVLMAQISPAGVKSTAFIKNGGTSSQFLMADGSVKALTDITSAYVTALGTNGNYLTWTKNGATNNVTVPYATNTSNIFPQSAADLNATTLNRNSIYSWANTATNTPGTYGVLFQWSNISAPVSGTNSHWITQLASVTDGGGLWVRTRTNTSDWRPWERILTTSNFNSLIGSGLTAYVRKAGDTMTGQLSIKTDTSPCLKLDSVTANKEVYMYVYSGGVAKTAVGWNNVHGSYIYNSPSNRYLGIKDNGTPHFQGNTLWHAGNDGARSGLDADLLDGYHKSDIYDNVTAKLSSLNDVLNSNGIRIYGFGYGDSASVANKPAGNSDARGTIGFGGIYCPMQLSWQYLGTDLYIRTKYSGNWQGWKRIAFTSDNVASATKWQTARRFWGQLADGTADVNGAMTVNYAGTETGISIYRHESGTGAFIRLYNNNQTTKHFRIGMYGAGYFGISYNSGADAIAVTTSGNVGIGTSAPGYTLDVNGSLHVRTLVYFDSTARINGDIWTNGQFFLNASGYDQQPYMSGAFGKFNLAFHRNGVWVDTVMTIMPNGAADMTGPLHVDKGIYTEGYVSARGQNPSSDARLKDVTGNVDLDIRAIARAPAVFFRWKDTGGEDVGSIAQYWQALMPQLTPRTPSGMLGLQYDKAALLGVVTVSRKVLDHEERIAALERENASLKATIENMRGNA